MIVCCVCVGLCAVVCICMSLCMVYLLQEYIISSVLKTTHDMKLLYKGACN